MVQSFITTNLDSDVVVYVRISWIATCWSWVSTEKESTRWHVEGCDQSLSALYMHGDVQRKEARFNCNTIILRILTLPADPAVICILLSYLFIQLGINAIGNFIFPERRKPTKFSFDYENLDQKGSVQKTTSLICLYCIVLFAYTFRSGCYIKHLHLEKYYPDFCSFEASK